MIPDAWVPIVDVAIRLMRESDAAASALGHQLYPWQAFPDGAASKHTLYKTSCSLCRLFVTVSPRSLGLPTRGEPLTLRCEPRPRVRTW